MVDISNITTYQAGVAQSSAYRNLNKLFSAMLKTYDLTSMQWFVLGTIFDSGENGIQLTQLSTKLQTGLPFITNTINLLQSKGMVERRNSLTDSRSKSVFIAESFIPTCRQIEADLRGKMRTSVYGRISQEDLTVYLRVLYQLSQLDKTEPLIQDRET